VLSGTGGLAHVHREPCIAPALTGVSKSSFNHSFGYEVVAQSDDL